MRARRVSVSIGICVAALLAGAPARALADSGGIAVGPADVNGVDPAVGGILIERVAAGASATATIAIANSTSTTVTLSVYAADGLTGSTTGIVYADAGAPREGAGAWLTPATSSVSVAGGEQQLVSFTATAPANALPGDHVAAVVVEQAATAPSGHQFSVGQVVRNVVPVDVLVNGSAAAQVTLGTPRIVHLPGTSAPALSIPLGNSGLMMCSPTLTATVSGEHGAPLQQTHQLDLVLPGANIDYPFALSAPLPSGTIHATVSASGCGRTESTRHIFSVATTTPTGSGQATPAAPAPVRTVPAPAPVVIAPAVPVALAPHKPAHHHDRAAHMPAAGTGAALTAAERAAAAARAAEARRHRQAAGGWHAIARVGRVVLQTASFPLALVVALILFLGLQDAIDRRDPKLALAPVHKEPDLAFELDPLAGAAA